MLQETRGCHCSGTWVVCRAAADKADRVVGCFCEPEMQVAISCDCCCICPVKWSVHTQRSKLNLRIFHHSIQKTWLQEGTKVGSDGVEGTLLQGM